MVNPARRAVFVAVSHYLVIAYGFVVILVLLLDAMMLAAIVAGVEREIASGLAVKLNRLFRF